MVIVLILILCNRKQADGSAVVIGATPIREVNRALDIQLPEDPRWTTVAGLCVAIFGHIPAPGEHIELEKRVIIEVIEATPRRIRSLRVRSSGPKEKGV